MILIIFLICTGFSTKLEIVSNVTNKTTYFTYTFYLNNTDSNTISFEKPKGSTIENAYYFNSTNKTPIFYTSAGDFFILKVDNPNYNMIKVKFKNENISKNINENNIYSQYLNFNINIEEINYTLILNNFFGVIENIYPRNYKIIENQSKIVWTIKDPKKDELILINFKKINNLNNSEIINKKKNTNVIVINKNWWNEFYILSLSSLIILVLLIYIIINKRKNKKIEEGEKEDNSFIKFKIFKKGNQKYQKEKNDENIDFENVNLITENYIKKETFEDFIKKYLTENEQRIVKIVKENEGITQSNILNHFPEMTKSNLSKIISKLDSKKILHKVRVGKVSKIYLGDKTKELE
jgi:hypothetical protein